AGNARQALDPLQPFGAAASDERIPALAGLHREISAAAVVEALDAFARDTQHEPGKACIRSEHVASSGEHEHRQAFGLRPTHRFFGLRCIVERDEMLRLTADAERGERRKTRRGDLHLAPGTTRASSGDSGGVCRYDSSSASANISPKMSSPRPFG